MKYLGKENVEEILQIVKQVYPSAYISLNKKQKAIINYNLPKHILEDPNFNGPAWIFLNVGCEVCKEDNLIVVKE